MSTTPEETARIVAYLNADDFSKRVSTHQVSEAADHLERLAYELAATRAELARTQTDLAFELRTIGMQARDWQQRAEAAESRLGEVEKALEWCFSNNVDMALARALGLSQAQISRIRHGQQRPTPAADCSGGAPGQQE